MKTCTILAVVVAAISQGVTAAGVVGAAEGFAKGVTGGGGATPVYPSSISELVSYLGDSSARVIVLSKTFDFTGSEGTASETGCAPWGTGSGCQTAINKDNWCNNYQASAPKVSVKYDKAGISGITVKSNKSIIGDGNKGVIKGKGLRIAGGAKNVIIQNIHITNINPQYVWGGDAISLDNTDLVWIDHVTTSLIGRQHIVLGNGPSNRVTISNNDINGATSWSATCPSGKSYWNIYLTGSNDLVTLKNNYIHHVSGRAPKVAGNTLLHAVNNYFYSVTGHAFEVDAGAQIVAEGNVFQNVDAPRDSSIGGKLFTSPSSGANAACKTYLGHNCELNAYGSSGAWSDADTSFFANFDGKNIASATSANNAKSVANTAGFGKI